MELANTIETKIYELRGVKVMLDSDLANLYEVETKVLNQAVKRNIQRFPSDFMFQLTHKELEILRSQIVTAKFTMTRTTPYVFTEHGVSMLSSVLKSQLAIQVNIQIMRTFTKMREFALNYKDIVTRIETIEKTLKTEQQHQNYNTQRIDEAFELLHQILQDTQNTNNNLIGFRVNEKLSNNKK